MSPYETKQLYLRLAYPEKFWKIANHYYNANKAWGFGRYLEKLEKIKAEEENREQFLAYMKHFAKEIRRTLRIREGDPLEIFTDREGEIILKKYSPIGELGQFAGEYAESLSLLLGFSIVVLI